MNNRISAFGTLSPQGLVRDFGVASKPARRAVPILYEALADATSEAAERWNKYFGHWADRAAARIAPPLVQLARRFGLAADGLQSDRLLFALQTYYAMIVQRTADRLLDNRHGDLLPEGPFSWCSRPILRWTEALDNACPATDADESGCDLFKPLYENLFPRALRHALGEYYTPDWLAEHVLDQVGYQGQPDRRLLDPACGSGTFLLLALRRMRKVESGEWGVESKNENASLSSLLSSLSSVVGIDLNPLAVLTARANFLIAVEDWWPTDARIEAPIYLGDSILGESADPRGAAALADSYDFVVGNPPWIAWDNLSERDRRATKPLWQRYGLFSLSGNEARHGGGKKDLSTLMLYAAADRCLKPGGRLGMVVTQTIFQTKGAGDGFRRFRLGQSGPPLRVLRVDDLTRLRPFDAANWTATIVLEKGAETQYPVEYARWDEGAKATPAPCHAWPVDPQKPNSPWIVLPKGTPSPSASKNTSSDYTAHLGVNSGGANAVYWVELLGAEPGGVRIRNVAGRAKRSTESVECLVEPDLLYPLLRWSDVGRYRAAPRGHLLMVQDHQTRAGIDEKLLQRRWPLTLAYLSRFRELLASRAAYRRYQSRGPFYSMYNVGSYSLAPIKVVWRRMDRRINAAVVEAVDDPLLGRRPALPQETCVFVACESADEAHYLCACMNSEAINQRVAASSVRGGKGFGTPGMLEFLPIRRFRPDDRRHAELAALGRQAYVGDSVQSEIDRLAADIFISEGQ